MVAAVEMAKDRELEKQPECERGGEREHEGGEEAAGPPVEHHRQIGAEHVLDAVREVDEVQHAEQEGKPGRDEKEQHAELEPVEDLDEEEAGGHARDS